MGGGNHDGTQDLAGASETSSRRCHHSAVAAAKEEPALQCDLPFEMQSTIEEVIELWKLSKCVRRSDDPLAKAVTPGLGQTGGAKPLSSGL